MEVAPLLKAALRWVVHPDLRARWRTKRSDHDLTYWKPRVFSNEYWNVWVKHLALLKAAGMQGLPENVAEFGPGDSCAVGISALLCGAKKYRGFDANKFVVPARDAQFVDEVFALASTQFPAPVGWPSVAEYLSDGSPLRQELSAKLGTVTAQDKAQLREAMAQPSRSEYVAGQSHPVQLVAPWQDWQTAFAPEFDLVLSHSVLQYMDDLPAYFKLCAKLMRPGAYTSHQIDFTSMKITKVFNGHLAYPEWLWKFIVSRQPYHPNRKLLKDYVAAIEGAGLELVRVLQYRDATGLDSADLSAPYRVLPSADTQCVGVFVVARKPGTNSEQ